MTTNAKKGVEGKPPESDDDELQIGEYIPLAERWAMDDDFIFTTPEKREEPTTESDAKSSEMFCLDENGKKSDAALHDDIMGDTPDIPGFFYEQLERLGIAEAFAATFRDEKGRQTEKNLAMRHSKAASAERCGTTKVTRPSKRDMRKSESLD